MAGHREQEQHLLHVTHDSELSRREHGIQHEDQSSPVGQSQRPEGSGQAGYKKKPQDRTTQPPRWHTKEFYLYCFVFVTVIPYMFKVGHDASSGEWNQHHNDGVAAGSHLNCTNGPRVHCHRVQSKLWAFQGSARGRLVRIQSGTR